MKQSVDFYAYDNVHAILTFNDKIVIKIKSLSQRDAWIDALKNGGEFEMYVVRKWLSNYTATIEVSQHDAMTKIYVGISRDDGQMGVSTHTNLSLGETYKLVSELQAWEIAVTDN